MEDFSKGDGDDDDTLAQLEGKAAYLPTLPMIVPPMATRDAGLL
jgi:hypothetical protein